MTPCGGLASEVLVRVDGRLAEIPAAHDARLELVRIVLGRLESLAADTGGDTGLEAELSAAYYQAGLMQGSLQGAGDPRASLRKAIEFGERTRASGKADWRALYVLCQAYFWLGTRSYDFGDNDEARKSFLRAIERGNDPKLEWHGAGPIARASKWLGRMEFDSGHVSRGVEWTEQSVVAAGRAVDHDRKVETISELVSSQLYLGRAAVLAGDLARAAELSRKSAAEATALYQANPANGIARVSFVEGLLGAGEGYTVPFDMQGRIVGIENVEKALEFARHLLEESPKVRSWNIWLMIAYLQQSFDANDPGKALAAARSAFEVVERQIAEVRPASTISIRNRAEVRTQLAECLRRVGDRIGAAEQATLAAREMADNFNDREGKASTLKATLLLASLHLESGDKARASKKFEVARSIAVPLAAADPSDMRLAAFLALSYEGLGKCASSPGPAAEWFAKSVSLWKTWGPNGKPNDYRQEHLREAQRLFASAASR